MAKNIWRGMANHVHAGDDWGIHLEVLYVQYLRTMIRVCATVLDYRVYEV